MKFRFRNNKKLIIMQSSILTLSTLISGCQNLSDNTYSSKDTLISTESSFISEMSSESTDITDTTSETETSIVYNLNWDQTDNILFSEYLQNEYNCNLDEYLFFFGYTDDLNSILTEYVNMKQDTNYNSIPFSEVKYFFRYLVENNPGLHAYDDYDQFINIFLNDSMLIKNTFGNKLILSYLLQNNIKFGERVNVSNFDGLIGYRLYSLGYDFSNDFTKQYGIKDFGNDSSMTYTNEQLLYVILVYNSQIMNYTVMQRINTGEITDSPEELERINSYLKRFFGDNAPQVGEYITREQYIAIFGEEPIDLSYIPGAIVEQNQNSDNDDSYSRSR